MAPRTDTTGTGGTCPPCQQNIRHSHRVCMTCGGYGYAPGSNATRLCTDCGGRGFHATYTDPDGSAW